MLVYRGFDIGAAKPTQDERQGVPHWLVDILEPTANFSVSQFQSLAQKTIAEIEAHGHLPLLVGGTGLYAQSLLEDYAFNQQAGNEDFRAHIQAIADEKGQEHVWHMLHHVDPETANRLHPHNFRRVMRALEVALLGGESISQAKRVDGALAYDAYILGLTCDRPRLYARIEQRVHQMMRAGLMQETKDLLAQGVSPQAQAMRGIGYRETVMALRGEMKEEDVVPAIQLATRHFAKRQLTWFRRMPYIHWYDIEQPSLGNLCARVCQDVQHWLLQKGSA